MNRVRRFDLDGTMLLSKRGAKIHPFEPEFSLQGEFHGNSYLSVCSNRACEATDKADFWLGGGNWWYEVWSLDILRATTMMTTKTKTIDSLQTEQITPEGKTGEGTVDRVEATALPATSPCGIAHRGSERWVSLAGMGRNSVLGERGVFVPAEAAAEDPPLRSGAHTQGLGKQNPNLHTPPPIGGYP